jgi:protein TonB
MTVELIREEPKSEPRAEEKKPEPPPIPPRVRESGGDPDKAPGNRPDVEKEAPLQTKEVQQAAKAREFDSGRPDAAAERKAEPKKEPPAPKTARQDPVPAAPKRPPNLSEVVGEGGGDRYLNEIVEDIEAKFVYPAVAEALGLTGLARYALLLDAKGQLLDVTLVASTGVGTLDQAGFDAIRRAAPFPPIPADIGRQIVRVDLKLQVAPRKK